MDPRRTQAQRLPMVRVRLEEYSTRHRVRAVLISILKHREGGTRRHTTRHVTSRSGGWLIVV